MNHNLYFFVLLKINAGVFFSCNFHCLSALGVNICLGNLISNDYLLNGFNIKTQYMASQVLSKLILVEALSSYTHLKAVKCGVRIGGINLSD